MQMATTFPEREKGTGHGQARCRVLKPAAHELEGRRRPRLPRVELGAAVLVAHTRAATKTMLLLTTSQPPRKMA